jgi:hypothetical protein
VYYLYSYNYNGFDYVVNIGHDIVEVYSGENIETPLYSVQLNDPRKCDYDDGNNILYVGCGRGKSIYKLTFPYLNYIDHIETDYEVWSVLVAVNLGGIYIGLSEWPDTNESWNMLDAPISKGWIGCISLNNFEMVNIKNINTIPRDILYSEYYNKLYVSCDEWVYSVEDGITKGIGHEILIIDPISLNVVSDIYGPDIGLNIIEGEEGYLYSGSISKNYHFDWEYLDGVGLIEYELDENGELNNYNLINIGSKKTTDVHFNHLSGEVYILVYGGEPDLVIYNTVTGEYELIEFTQYYISHFCISSDFQKLYLASPEAGAILIYEL